MKRERVFGDDVADGEALERRSGGHHSSPRTTIVETAVTTWAPVASVMEDSAVIIEAGTERLHAGDRERAGEQVARDDRAAGGEPLVAVHHP